MVELQNSREAEVSVLGTLMVEPSGFSRVYAIIKDDDFFFPDTKKVFSTMYSLFVRGIEINVQTVLNHFKVEGYEGISEFELRDFLDYRVSVETAISFSVQIAEFSGWRSLKFGLEKLNEEVNSGKYSLTDVSQKISSIASTISSKGLKDDIVHGSSMLEEYLEMLDRPKNLYAFSGIKSIDFNIYDFNPKELSIIAARPGQGKSTYMLQSALANALRGNRVGFLSMEMERSKLFNRLVSHRSRISGTRISRMNSQEFSSNSKLVSAAEEIGNLPIFIDDTGPWTSEAVPKKIRKLFYEYNCNLIYVDYIGLIVGSGELASAPRNQQLTRISADLKSLASELAIPILAASQLNRDVEKRSTSRPMLADLRDSGSLEQDASIVAFLYPNVSQADDSMSLLENENEMPVILEIAKQRNGPVNQFELVLNKKFGLFESLEEKNATY